MPSSLRHILQRLAHSLLQLCETDTNIIPILQLRKLRLDEVWQPVRGRHARIPKLSGLDSNIFFSFPALPVLLWFITYFS